ncbi:MAG: M64 family metallopeptidase, partial [Bryobacteraceae bacterium]
MGASDGTILGSTKILNNGPDNARMNIVLVGDGFKATEQSAFNTRCDEFVAALQAEPWYPAVGGAINVFRLNVTSTDSGADDPAGCSDEPGDGTVAATFFDSTFCTGGVHRCLAPNWLAVKTALDANLPQWYAGAVLVNTTKRGGCAQPSYRIFATGFGTKPGESWEQIALHEFGHAAFDLADEYGYYLGCDSGETDRDNAPAFEPSERNVTTNTTLAGLAVNKPMWAELITPEIPVPTMQNPDCSECDTQANVLTDDSKIGVFESAKYYHCGLYRPAYLCRMRKVTAPFCAVCVQAMAAKLSTFIPATPRMEVVTGNGSLLLDFGDVTYGLTMYRSFEVRNKRVGFPGTLRANLSPPSGQFTYAPNTDLSFTLPAPVNESYTARKVFVSFTSTNVGGPDFYGSLQVSTPDDPVTSLVTVDLHAKAVPPEPVDSVLIFDRSGSMSEPTGVPAKKKVDMAIEAGKLYVSLLKDNDRIGLVRFNDGATNPGDILLGMEVAGEPGTGTGRVDANNELTTANLNPSGNTSIGAG